MTFSFIRSYNFSFLAIETFFYFLGNNVDLSHAKQLESTYFGGGMTWHKNKEANRQTDRQTD